MSRNTDSRIEGSGDRKTAKIHHDIYSTSAFPLDSMAFQDLGINAKLACNIWKRSAGVVKGELPVRQF